MSDEKDDNPFDPERMAARRADKLSRAMEQARQRRLALETGQTKGDDTTDAPVKRKPKLPPPPPPDPKDWRALGLPPTALANPAVPRKDREQAGESRPEMSKDPLILGTGDTKAVGAQESAADRAGQAPVGASDDQAPTLDPLDTSAADNTSDAWGSSSEQFEHPLPPASAMRLPADEGQDDWTTAPVSVPVSERGTEQGPVADTPVSAPPTVSDLMPVEEPQAQEPHIPDPVDRTPPPPRALFGGAPVAPGPDLPPAQSIATDDDPDIAPNITPAPQPAALLTLSGVHTDIGRYRVLQGVNLEVPEGQVTMLLGRNGVGKTTTLRTIMGLWRAREGEILMGGRNLATMQPAAIARSGIGYVPEDMGVFGDLTVEENMRLGALSGRPNRTRLEWLLGAFPALKTFWTRPAATLSGGQKQMLSIARTMVEPRRLYLIDEPTKGLAPAIVATLAGALRELKHEGATILMVEQNFAVAKALGDTCAVMDDGKVTWSGSMAELAEDAELQAQHMGLHLEPGH